jgi:hypothetical protein
MPIPQETLPAAGAPRRVNLMAQDLRAAQSFRADIMNWTSRPSTLAVGPLAAGAPSGAFSIRDRDGALVTVSDI